MPRRHEGAGQGPEGITSHLQAYTTVPSMFILRDSVPLDLHCKTCHSTSSTSPGTSDIPRYLESLPSGRQPPSREGISKEPSALSEGSRTHSRPRKYPLSASYKHSMQYNGYIRGCLGYSVVVWNIVGRLAK